MSYKVAIRRNDTGEVRVAGMDDLDWDESSLAWWTEGNGGCDCNRGRAFARAGGGEPGPGGEACGDGAYTVLHAELPDGTRIPIDEPAAGWVAGPPAAPGAYWADFGPGWGGGVAYCEVEGPEPFRVHTFGGDEDDNTAGGRDHAGILRHAPVPPPPP